MKLLKRLFTFDDNIKASEFKISPNENNIDYDVRAEKPPVGAQLVFADIDENLSYIRNRFSVPRNNDFVIREIMLRDARRAFVVFVDGMVDTDSVNLAIIKTFQELPYFAGEDAEMYGEETAYRFASHSQLKITDDMDDIAEEVNFGSCAVFVDKLSRAFVFDVRSWGTRGIDKPENEQSVYGPQEAFAEMLRNNTALIRKIIKTEKLIAEGVKLGEVSKTRGVLLYIEDIANPDLVNEVRRRLNGITTDYIVAIEEVALMLEESTYMPTTQILATERPDRAARALTEGRVALLLNGSPRALIMPTSVFELNHAVSDAYLRVPYANMARIIRLIAMFASVLLPGLYLAVTLFHQEVIPTYLLYSIAASRESVPFGSVMEFILMDVSFEMIREAGLRMPGKIGSTLGIVGGLILGQAAVSAKLVSPIMIIIIAITGIGSFAVSDYSMGWSFRILRLIFVFLGCTLGFYGISIGIVLYSLHLASAKTFGVPFLAPMPKAGSRLMTSSVFENPIWKREKRPSFLAPKNDENEPPVSKKY